MRTDALLQKKYTVDFLQKKYRKNAGEIPQYYVEGNHEAIIEPAVFDMVQEEIARRSGRSKRYSGINIFASKIRCGCCGDWYGAKVWHSNDPYRRIIYRCNSKYKHSEKCNTPHVTEGDIKTLFLKTVSILLEKREELIENIQVAIGLLCDTGSLQKELDTLQKEMKTIAGLIQSDITANARVAIDQNEYNARHQALMDKYQALKTKHAAITGQMEEMRTKAEALRQFISLVETADIIPVDFDEGFWSATVQHVTIYSKTDIRFTFKDGTEIKA